MLGSIIGSWQHGALDDYGARLDAHARSLLMYDLMDVLSQSWQLPLAPPLPPCAVPLGAAGDEHHHSAAELRCSEGSLFAKDDEIEHVLGCWPHIRVFVGASSPDVSHERTFLLDFVLPALRVQACSRRVCLAWSDPMPWPDAHSQASQAQAPHAQLAHSSLEQTRDVTVSRLRALQACRIRSHPQVTQEQGIEDAGGGDGRGAIENACTLGALDNTSTLLNSMRQPFAIMVLGQRVGEPLAPGAQLKDALRDALGHVGVRDARQHDARQHNARQHDARQHDARQHDARDLPHHHQQLQHVQEPQEKPQHMQEEAQQMQEEAHEMTEETQEMAEKAEEMVEKAEEMVEETGETEVMAGEAQEMYEEAHEMTEEKLQHAQEPHAEPSHMREEAHEMSEKAHDMAVETQEMAAQVHEMAGETEDARYVHGEVTAPTYGWLASSFAEEQGRMVGPSDVELMHGVLFREEPSCVVLVKMSVLTEDDNFAQVCFSVYMCKYICMPFLYVFVRFSMYVYVYI